jgi:hypothetical protein
MILWVWFSVNVIKNITLAQVSDGFVEQQESSSHDWLTKPQKDPGLPDELWELKNQSLTIPDLIKNRQ